MASSTVTVVLKLPYSLICCLLLIVPIHGNGNNHTGEHSGGLHVVAVAYNEVRDPLIFTIVVLLAGISKIGYHHSNFLSSKVPESCILIILGTVFGAVIHFSGISMSLPEFFQPHEFFIFLLPPIILEAAFSLHDRTFAENLGSILLFAVVGTVLACAFLGVTLYGLLEAGAMGEMTTVPTFLQIMVFSSLIVAVDPVAVLAVFNEIGVNHVLYFLVFGESLLNDGVTVVLYKVFQAYNDMDEITGLHIFLGIVKFFVVCLGGFVLGVLAGIASAILTKFSAHVKVVQPIIIYTMAYFGFLMAELFEFSGIISIVGCGLIQMQYAFNNINDKSRTTIKYFTKVISSANEIIIFLFLGLSMVNENHEWHTGFTLWTIFFCLVYRFIIIFGMTYLINYFDIYRVRTISLHEQFMIAYGGLRGAVCFSLVALLDPNSIPNKNMFMTTTLAVIIFTVFVQGITIKPLVYLLEISLAPEKNPSMYKELNSHVTDHMMAGIEDIIGDHGRNHLREKLESIDSKYLKPLLQVAPDPRDANLKIFYENLLLKEHYKYLKLSGAKTPDIPEIDSGPGALHSLGRHSFRQALSFMGHHVNTELLLSSLAGEATPALASELPDLERRELMEPSPRLRRGQKSQQSSPATPAITVDMALDEADSFIPAPITLRPRERKSRAMSLQGGDTNIDPRTFRSLLNTRRNTRMVLSKYDRNLTSGEDIHTEIRKKTTINRQLQQMYQQEAAEDTANTTGRRKSWSETNAQLCEEREKAHKAPPRHAMTVDLGNAGRLGTFNPLGTGGVDDSLTPFSAASTLDSVFEEEEISDDNHPMLNEDGQKLMREGQRSSKHKLERQMGLEKTDSPSALHRQREVDSQNVPLFSLGKSESVDSKRVGKGSSKDDSSRV